MPLPPQSLLETKKQTSPKEFADLLKSSGDSFYWEKGNFHVITKHHLAQQVLTSSDYSADRSSFFISRMPNMDLSLIKDFFGVVSKMMVMSDADAHLRRRKIAAAGLSDTYLEHFEPIIENTVNRLLAQVQRQGKMEFVHDVALSLPSIVLADLFAIQEKDRPDFYRWSNNMTQFFGGASQYRNEDGREVNDSAIKLRSFFENLMETRRTHPQDDFFSRMIQSQDELGLSDGELVAQAIMMLVAGQITTTDQMCNNLYTLLTLPNAKESLRSNFQFLETALEEFNRLDPAVTFIFRVVRRDTLLGTQVFKTGDVIFISTHAVNRDADVFERPHDCILDRKQNGHMAYGFGPHFCFGAKLARLEMKYCFKELLSRFPKMALAKGDPSIRKHDSLAFSGFERLPVQLAT